MTGRLAGRCVVITGATGIAAAAAHRFASEGARLFLVSRTPDHLHELAHELAATGTEAGWVVADLADDAQAEAAMAAATDSLGRIDGLFAVAGGSGRRFGDAPVHELTASGWDATLALNARSQVLTIGAALRRMLVQDADGSGARGVIVGMSSILASHPEPSLFPTPAYAAAKGAISTLIRVMAATYVHQGIRVNAVAPALTTSRMSVRASADDATQRFARRRQPLTGGFLAPEDVADAALFLLSTEARAITGQVLLVDGGWSVTTEQGDVTT